jgi:pectin methylesterase-like acyl-CoA thioesterase
MSRTTRRAACASLLGTLLAIQAATAPARGACPGGADWCDDFEHGAAQWRRDDGAAAATRSQDSGANQLLLAQAGAATLLATEGAASKLAAIDHFVEARVRPAATPGDATRRAYLMVRYADPRNWIGAGINLAPGSRRMTVDLVQMHDGQMNRLRQLGHDAAPAGSFYTLRVELANGELAAWLDGERFSATLPAPLQAAGIGMLAQDGAFELDDVRVGPAGMRPGRIALARMIARIGLQAGDVQRYPVSALAGDGATPLAITAQSSDSSVAQAAVEGQELVVTARRPGTATITVASADDRNVSVSITATIGPAFATGASDLPPPGRLVPAAGAGEVQVDTLLRIRFDQAPTLGSGGSIRIYRAADNVLVDVIRLGEEADSIGYRDQPFQRVVRVSPVRVEGRDVVIHPHSTRLEYGTEYLVAVDAAAFAGASVGGMPFAGIGANAGWRFRTRAHAPAGRLLNVDDDGPADFRTVQGALNHAMQALARAEPVTIQIANGRYDELLYLRGKDRVSLRGESRDGTVIAALNDDGINPGSGAGQGALSPGANGGRAVFLVEDADLLTLDNLTLANTTVRATSLGAQAETLNFSSDRGRLVARNASFLSEQDTIQVKGYSWFYRSLVAGNVDFIWGGNRAALFEESEIRSVGDSAHPGGGGYVVQARTVDAAEPGFVFLNSYLTHGPGPAGNDLPPASTWLARPGPPSTWDKVVYINCKIDTHIAPGGWSLPKAAPHGGHTGSGWAEAGSKDLDGRPLDLSRRAGGRVLTAAEAARYTTRARVFANFDNGKGWNPSPQ